MFSTRFDSPSFLFGAGLPDLKEFIDEFATACSAVASYPLIDIWQNDDEARVRVELPGLKAEDVKLSVLRDELTLEGPSAPVELNDGDKYFQRERRGGSFNRTVKLPFEVEAEAIEAEFSDGVLEICLPRSEAERARKIDIKVV
jgi:HSP20 family protein